MASIIRIKRSAANPSPTALASGELAYTWEASTGGKLLIGWGDEVNGEAVNISPIGGKYFADMLDHTVGIATANSALLLGATKNVDEITIGQIKLTNNTISTLTGNLIFDVVGVIDVGAVRITNLATPTANKDATTKEYVDASTILNIIGDSGTDAVDVKVDTLTFVGATGLTTTVSNNQVSTNLDNTSVNVGGYGAANSVGTFTVDQQGRLTAAQNISIQIVTSQITNFQENVQDIIGSLVSGDDASGIDVTYDDNDNSITITAQDASGANKGVASFNTTNFTATSGVITTDQFTIGSTNLNNGLSTNNIEGLTLLGAGTITISGNTIASTTTNQDIIISPNGTGTVDVNNSRITNLSEPINPTDAATKAYVDATAEGLTVKPSVKAATTGPLTATYDNGVSGVGSSLVSTSNGVFPALDGVSGWVVGNGILVKDQTNEFENGRYDITDLGDGANPWVLTRCDKSDAPTEIPSMFIFVQEGTLANSTGWVATVDTLPLTVGTGDITFIQFSGSGTYIAGDGLSITGTEFSVNVDDSTLELSSDTLRVKDLGITNAKLAGSIANNKLVNPFIRVAANTGAVDDIPLGETITFIGGTGIDTVASAANNRITITGRNASDSVKGIASFNIIDFANSSGAISLQVERIEDIVAGFAVGGTGITLSYDDTNGTLSIDGDLATTSSVGVAAFSSDNFAVDTGVVTVIEIDGGTF